MGKLIKVPLEIRVLILCRLPTRWNHDSGGALEGGLSRAAFDDDRLAADGDDGGRGDHVARGPGGRRRGLYSWRAPLCRKDPGGQDHQLFWYDMMKVMKDYISYGEGFGEID